MRVWRGAGVPQGCRIRDGRRRELVSAPRCRLHETGPGFDALTLDGAVHGGAADAEGLGDLESAVLAAVDQRHEVGFLAAVELGCLPRNLPLALATFIPSRVRSLIRSDSIMWTVLVCQAA